MHCHWLEVLVYDCCTLSTTGHSFWALTVYFGCSHSSSNLGVITLIWLRFNSPLFIDCCHSEMLGMVLWKLTWISGSNELPKAFIYVPSTALLSVCADFSSQYGKAMYTCELFAEDPLPSLSAVQVHSTQHISIQFMYSPYTHTHTHACIHTRTHARTHTQSCHLNWEIHLA